MRLLRLGMAVSFVALGASAVTSLTACPIATIGIFDSYMSLDGDRQRNVFFTDSTKIQCTADIRGARADATTEILIRQTQTLSLQRTAAPENAIVVYTEFAGPGKHTIDARPADKKDASDDSEAKPFPPGRYQCEIYIDGKLESTMPFNIDFAPCPPRLIENGAKCGGYYEQNRSCPQGGIGVPGNGIPEPAGGRCSCTGQDGALWTCGK